MITRHTFDLAAGRAREEAIMLHIGRMAVKAAAIDEVATIVLARALAPADEAVATAAFTPEMFGTKMRFLERALPRDWPDRTPLINAIRRVEEHRNSLAHSTVHTIYGLLEPSESTRLHSTKGGWKDPDPEEFARWEARGDVTYAALYQLSNEDEPDTRHHQLRDLVVWYFGNSQPPGIAAALDELFPDRGGLEHAREDR